ncbi:hypothetical protein OG474_13645 [Kribbella sp. NBC_01505]|uniref:hypothetical protein n=1 Tax=Kribbella sp. NBC_01505 TaxID=2903580 RepID=UPI00386CE8BD
MTRKPFPLPIPPILRPYILDFHWDVSRLHALDLPAAELTVAELAHHLDLPFWAYDGRPFQVTPYQVAADPARYHQQHARTLAADLGYTVPYTLEIREYPIDVVRREDGRITVLDGLHRLLHAELAGRTVIAVRVLDWARLDEIALHP